MSRVLVTGGAGFIGSHFVKSLVAGGHEVAVLVRPATSLHRLGSVLARVRIVNGDFEQPDSVVSGLAGWRPELCAHLAWYAEPRTYLESPVSISHLTASLALLQKLSDAGCKRYLISGTCAEYAPSRTRLHEDSAVGPQTLYAACKLSLQMVSAQLANRLGARVTWVRIFHLYGPDENESRLVPSVIHALLSNREFHATSGEQVRDYTHVADVGSAMGALIDHDVDGIVNVCSGVEVTVREVIETIADLIDRPELVRFGKAASGRWDPPYLCGDNTRLINAAGWSPQYDLRAGLAQTIGWWRSQSNR